MAAVRAENRRNLLLMFRRVPLLNMLESMDGVERNAARDQMLESMLATLT